MAKLNEAEIRSKLEEMVSTGHSGQRLPPERDLAEQLGVARMTLRRFIDAFVRDGRLERRVGSGTYIRRPMIASRMQMASFTDEMTARGLTPSSILVEREKLELPLSTATLLGAPVGAPAQRITRVRCGDGDPIAVEIVTIPDAVGLELSDDDLAGSLYQTLSRNYSINVSSANVDISVGTAAANIAKLLGVATGEPVMRIEMIDVDTDGRRIMAATCWYRADRYHVKLSAVRSANRGDN